jgi:ATP/maltotriose-dependent transcriptional regulator MalT
VVALASRLDGVMSRCGRLCVCGGVHRACLGCATARRCRTSHADHREARQGRVRCDDARRDQLLRGVPTLGVLVEQAARLRDQVSAMRAMSGDWAPLLTEAELRVLPLLATHLTIAEIAERQYVSRGTVKTQAISI